MSFSEISDIHTAEAFTHTALPSLLQEQPRLDNILQAASQSESRGQLHISDCPLHSTAAASIGNALFFAPCTESSPSMRRPPFIMSLR